MSRSAMPSQAQQELLLNCLVEKQWLAKGIARTSHQRERTRTAWQEIAKKLNSDGIGCCKTWQQWSKYWKDKKSATKRKYSKIRLARQGTGGGAVDEIILSEIEERIIAIMGNVSDGELDIKPFKNTVYDQPAILPTDLLETAFVGLNETNIEPAAGSSSTSSESDQQAYEDSIVAEPGTDPQTVDMKHHTSTLLLDNTCAPGIATSSVHIAPPSVTSSPRLRRVTPRRRLLRRTQPSQRLRTKESLTERFLALEEQRIEIELTRSRNQQELLGILRTLSGSWTRQNQLLEQLINRFLNMAE